MIGTIIGVVGIVGFLYVLFLSIEMEEESHAKYLREQEELDRKAHEDHPIFPNLFADGVERRKSKPLPDIEVGNGMKPSRMAPRAYESRSSQNLITYDAPMAFVSYDDASSSDTSSSSCESSDSSYTSCDSSFDSSCDSSSSFCD